MVVEVKPNANCEQSVCARFKEAGPARRVAQVKTFERRSEGEWCRVTGWTDDPEHPCCPAHAQRVEDSGSGLAYLIFGGIGGIRLKPISLSEEWDLNSANQWGEPYLLLADPKDINYEDPNIG
jgi:hypothetical protein